MTRDLELITINLNISILHTQKQNWKMIHTKPQDKS